MKNKFSTLAIFVLVFFLCKKSNAQFEIGNDTSICSTPLTLYANGAAGGGGGGGGTGTITHLNLGDDVYSGIINLGFPFVYYGITYTQVLLSTNGYITFDLSNANGYSPWSIGNAIPSPSNPVNSIFFPDQDLYPPAGGQMTYATCGSGTSHKFIFNFDNMPMFSCNNLLFTGQAILVEGTNEIEMHITTKPLCSSWNGGAGIEGVQNLTGTLATWVLNRNYPNQWTANNDAYKLVPNGASAYTVSPIPFNPSPIGGSGSGIDWYENGVYIGSGDSIIVNPVNVLTQYSAEAFTCVGSEFDTIMVGYDQMTLQISQSNNPSCANSFDGSIIATVTGGTGPFTYLWIDSTGTVIFTDNTNGSSTLSNIGTGQFNVIASSSIGCQLQDSSTLVAAFFQADFSWTPTGYCQGQVLQFQDQSSGVIPIGWQYDFGDGGSVNLIQNPSHYYVDSGLFSVSLINFVPGGCSDTVTHVIQVWPAPIAAFTVSSTTVCVGQMVIFNDKTSYYPKQWAWNFGDTSAIVSGNTNSHYYTAPGTYNVTLITLDSLCGADTASGVISVFSYPITNIGNDTAVCKGTILKLDAGITGVEYTWSTGASSQSISVSPTKPTEYNVTLNNHGCTFNDAIEIGILCELYIPNAFSPNRDGTNDIFIPFGTEVTFVSMRVYNRWGQMVYSGSSDNKGYKGWNGYFGTDEAAIGVYSYIISATFINNETKEYKGNVTLLR